MNTVALLFAVFPLAFALVLSEPPQEAEPPRSAVVARVVPFYPPAARAAHVAGEVVVEVRLDAEGSVTSAEAVSGPPLLRDESVRSAAHWRFAPGAAGATLRLTFEYLGPADVAVLTDSPYRATVVSPRPPDTVRRYDEADVGRACELHGFVLEKDQVRIAYGLLPYPPADYLKAARTQFPNSNSQVEGGCVVSDDSPKYAEVLYCRACRAAEECWSHGQRAWEPRG